MRLTDFTERRDENTCFRERRRCWRFDAPGTKAGTTLVMRKKRLHIWIREGERNNVLTYLLGSSGAMQGH